MKSVKRKNMKRRSKRGRISLQKQQRNEKGVRDLGENEEANTLLR